MATVLLIGTLDTKGLETAFLRDRIRVMGCNTIVLDSGILGEAIGIEADFTRQVVAEASGNHIDALRNAGTRGKAIEEMLKGVRKLTLDLFEAGRIHGVVSLGGAEGAVLAASAMKILPIGFPKLIVSPVASGHRKFAPFIGTKDVTVMHSVVDILGLNAVSRDVFDRAAGAITGMAIAYEKSLNNLSEKISKGSIAVTMLGNTTRPLMRIKPQLEALDMEVVIFHANGVGGRAMEELIQAGYFAAVIDYTLNEVAGVIGGGYHDGGTTRLDAASSIGIPQVVVPSCLDFAVFGAAHEVPEKYDGRPIYYHNPEFTLVQLTEKEQLEAAHFIVEKLNKATGQVIVINPMNGGSVMDNREGGSFWDASITQARAEIFRSGLSKRIQYHEVDAHINDALFADFVLEKTRHILV